MVEQVFIIRDSEEVIIPKFINNCSNSFVYILEDFRDDFVDGSMKTGLRIYIPEGILCVQKSIYYDLENVEKQEDMLRLQQAVQEEFSIPNNKFNELKISNKYLNSQNERVFLRTGIAHYLFFNKVIKFLELKYPSKLIV